MKHVEVTREDAQHVLWHYGHPAGVQPGSFTEQLVAAALKADPANQARLQEGFPSLVAAVQASQMFGGLDFLVQVAENPPVEFEAPPAYAPVLSFVVFGEPVSKGRPRSGNGQPVYTPKRTRDAEKKLRSAFEAMHPGFVPLTGRLAFHADFYRETGRYVDVDNLLKLCTDALNGVAFRDDEQVEQLSGERIYRAGNQARTVITISQRIEELPELFGNTEKE